MHVEQDHKSVGDRSEPPARLGRLRGALDRVQETYDGDGEVDLVARAGALAAYGLTASALVATVLRSGHRPARFDVTDLLLGGIATHKFARLVTKSSVASPLRAPFTTFVECSGPSEHSERPREGNHVQHAIGELLTCPFCLGVWIGTGYVAALAVAPRGARVWAAVFTVTAVADTMQHAYDAVKHSDSSAVSRALDGHAAQTNRGGLSGQAG
jgi:hypothetical protein